MVAVAGSKLAEEHSKSPDLASWGAPVLLRTEVQLKTVEGLCHYIFKCIDLVLDLTDFTAGVQYMYNVHVNIGNFMSFMTNNASSSGSQISE